MLSVESQCTMFELKTTAILPTNSMLIIISPTTNVTFQEVSIHTSKKVIGNYVGLEGLKDKLLKEIMLD